MEDNKKEFIELKEKYETLTLEVLQKSTPVKRKMERLTGFGSASNCTLCKSAAALNTVRYRSVCEYCFWMVATGLCCSDKANGRTYNQIRNAKSDAELAEAIKARVERMNFALKTYSGGNK